MSEHRTSAGHVEMVSVWRKFRYGRVHSRLRDAIPAVFRRAFGGQRARAEDLREHEFWALQDVSFSVRPGEALGVIGPNGAGKSTVLKLLTGIMQPTAGRCTVRGRVGALIEVSAGFHPDLTGRENVFLQGVIMGMPKREIARKFDQIVAFAEVAPFIDTPVKRYSTGMEARLGFAIAAHLEPDVLMVDEVLAVGDASFQSRAFAKVRELVRQEIPVVIVSHDLEAITSFCTAAVLLDRGRVARAGTPRECIAAYLHGVGQRGATAQGDGGVRIEGLELLPETVDSGDRLRVTLACAVVDGGAPEQESVGVRVRSAHAGVTFFETGTSQLGTELPATGSFALQFELQMNLPPGVYSLESFAWNRALGRESFAGPATYLQVGGAPFQGIAQLNPRVQLEPGPSGRPAR